MIGRPEQDLNVVLIESIRETIAQLLSPKVAETLFEHLEKVYSIRKDEVPSRLDMLLLTLKTTFGSSSAQVIGKAIARRLFDKLDLTFINNPNLTVLEYVEEAKMKVREKGDKA